MHADNETLMQWWKGLSEPERADAFRAQETGRLTKGVRRSLRGAGVLGTLQGQTQRKVPPPVYDFLKMRH